MRVPSGYRISLAHLEPELAFSTSALLWSTLTAIRPCNVFRM